MRAEPALRILVIRLGALGDFVLSFPAFAAIRAHHPGARITLLTTRPFAPLAARAPWFDHVDIDRRPQWWDLPGLVRLRRTLRGPHSAADPGPGDGPGRGPGPGYDLVYDLQTSARSGHYHRLAGRPPWSGIAPGCSLPHANPARNAIHTIDRQRDQLAHAGIPAPAEPAAARPAAAVASPAVASPWPDLAWLAAAPVPPLPAAFAVLVPGAAPHRPEKRWPAERFGQLARTLHRRGLAAVVVGSSVDGPLAAAIRTACPDATDLTGRTDLATLAAVLAGASLVVGNDTGPMHLAAALGRRCLVLFSDTSDPALTAPRGAPGQVAVLRVADLRQLGTEQVAAALA